jgi:hypothetical protein
MAYIGISQIPGVSPQQESEEYGTKGMKWGKGRRSKYIHPLSSPFNPKYHDQEKYDAIGLPLIKDEPKKAFKGKKVRL